MTAYFLDSNIIIKYYYTEPGSNWVRGLINDEQNTCLISEISVAEVAAGLSQLRRQRKFGWKFLRITFERFQEDLQRKQFLAHAINLETLNLAATFALTYPIKGYDAVQVAAAIVVQERVGVKLTLLSGDKQILVTARSVGVLTDDPFTHVLPTDFSY